jgi:hypothetical protein
VVSSYAQSHHFRRLISATIFVRHKLRLLGKLLPTGIGRNPKVKPGQGQPKWLPAPTPSPITANDIKAHLIASGDHIYYTLCSRLKFLVKTLHADSGNARATPLE